MISRLLAHLVSLVVSDETSSSPTSSEARIAPERADAYLGQAAQGAPVEGTTPQASVLQEAASGAPTRSRQQVISRLPQLPTELSIDILSRAALNPLELMALVETGDASGSPHGLQHWAGLNEFWITYTPAQDITEDAAEGAYARAFIARYRAMTPDAQALLSDLWARRDGATTHLTRFSVSNFDLMRAAVSQSGLALHYADPALRRDHALVLTAVSQYGYALHDADPTLRRDRAIALAAVSQNGHALHYADPDLRRDRDLVLAAVTQDGFALQYADPALRRDRDLVLAAVSQNGHALHFADPALHRDRALALAAVTQSSDVLQYLHPDLRDDPELIQQASGA